MFIDTTLERIVLRLDECAILRDDTIVPAETRDPGHSPYRPGYEWLFFYERSLARSLDPWLKQYRSVLFGSCGIVSEALSNAFCHGNRRSATLPIHVDVRAGRSGVLISVTDSGSGFDVDSVVSTARRGRQHSFRNAGNGLRVMADSKDFGVFFSSGGQTCHIAYLISGFDAGFS